MKKISIIVLILIMGISTLMARRSKTKELKDFNYQIESFGVAHEGEYSIKVFSIGKNIKKAKEAISRDAIHGVLFKGVSASKTGPSQPALIKDFQEAYNSHREFLETFFKDKIYEQFIMQENNEILPGDCIRIHKGYKVGIVVVINVKSLRKYLEKNNIINKLW